MKSSLFTYEFGQLEGLKVLKQYDPEIAKAIELPARSHRTRRPQQRPAKDRKPPLALPLFRLSSLEKQKRPAQLRRPLRALFPRKGDDASFYLLNSSVRFVSRNNSCTPFGQVHELQLATAFANCRDLQTYQRTQPHAVHIRHVMEIEHNMSTLGNQRLHRLLDRLRSPSHQLAMAGYRDHPARPLGRRRFSQPQL